MLKESKQERKMKMLNRTVLVGRLTKDVELNKTQSGLSVCKFIVAVNRMKDKDGNQQADFPNVIAWRQSADFLCQYGHKGDLIGIEGRIQTRNYDGSDGKKVYVTEVVADNVQILESRKNKETSTPNYSGTQSEDSQFEDFNAGPSLDISSDDLPF